MEKMIDFLNGFNAQTLFGMSVILWYFIRDFKRELKVEIEEIRKEVKEIREEGKEQARRSDRLYQMFIDLLKESKK